MCVLELKKKVIYKIIVHVFLCLICSIFCQVCKLNIFTLFLQCFFVIFKEHFFRYDKVDISNLYIGQIKCYK